MRIASLVIALVLMGSQAWARADLLGGAWHVGVNLGELPWQGSLKPGLHVGYHLNELVYVGVVYQVPDQIERNGSSFNAQATGLAGLLSSAETVGQRMALLARLRPHRYAPYLSTGLVYNGRDTEILRFDDRLRRIGGSEYRGELVIEQSRPPGLRPAIGLGYELTLASGVAMHVEWSGWWLQGAPAPQVVIRGAPLSEADRRVLLRHITSEFTSNPFNTYHLFQLGVGYTF